METESKIRKWLQDDVKFILLIIGIVTSVIFNWMTVRGDVALIEQRVGMIEDNHLVHIQDSLKSMDERLNSMDERDRNMEKNIATILALLSNNQ